MVEKLNPWYVLRLERNVEVAVPLSGTTTNVDNVGASEHVAAPEGSLSELPKSGHDEFDPGVG